MADFKKKPESKGDDFGYVLEIIIAVFLLFLLVQFFRGQFQGIGGADGISENAFVSSLIFTIKIISGVVTLLAILGISYIVFFGSPNKKEEEYISTQQTSEGGNLDKEWSQIRERLENASDEDASLIVVDADALLDRALKELHVTGNTMGERLQNISTPSFKSAQGLWDAHKIRNKIAHGEGGDVVYADALYAIERYEKGLRELGVIH